MRNSDPAHKRRRRLRFFRGRAVVAAANSGIFTLTMRRLYAVQAGVYFHQQATIALRRWLASSCGDSLIGSSDPEAARPDIFAIERGREQL